MEKRDFDNLKKYYEEDDPKNFREHLYNLIFKCPHDLAKACAVLKISNIDVYNKFLDYGVTNVEEAREWFSYYTDFWHKYALLELFNNNLSIEENKINASDLTSLGLIQVAKLIITPASAVIYQGTLRDFDIIDYNVATNNLDGKEFINSIRNSISALEIQKICAFLGFAKKPSFRFQNLNNKTFEDKEIQYILNSNDIVGIKYDEPNTFVVDNGREITKEEKLMIINYIKELGCHVDAKTYRAGLKRYLNGYLDCDLGEKLIRQKNSDYV